MSPRQEGHVKFSDEEDRRLSRRGQMASQPPGYDFDNSIASKPRQRKILEQVNYHPAPTYQPVVVRNSSPTIQPYHRTSTVIQPPNYNTADTRYVSPSRASPNRQVRFVQKPEIRYLDTQPQPQVRYVEPQAQPQVRYVDQQPQAQVRYVQAPPQSQTVRYVEPQKTSFQP